jgi:hypothetical protein
MEKLILLTNLLTTCISGAVITIKMALLNLPQAAQNIKENHAHLLHLLTNLH